MVESILSGDRKNLNMFSSNMVKTIYIKTIFTALVMIFLTSNAGAIDLNSCTYISQPGEYVLSQDIITTSNPYSCINVYASDVIINGNGFSIDGNGYIGISIPGVNGSGSPQNVTVKNLKITGWDRGIYLGFSSNYNYIFRNNISNNYEGIYLANATYNNQIYDNYFDNIINANGDIVPNYWNTTKQAGINIIGGPYIGGNYWSDYIGNDTDGDGLGDEFTPHNRDYLPLTNEKVTEVVNPGETVTTDLDGSGPTDYDTVETSITIPSEGTGTTISIEETSATQPPPEGYFLVGQEISISAPDTGATTLHPLVINFTIDSTLIPLGQTDLDNINVYRNGVEVTNCIAISPIDPDPCIFEMVILPTIEDGRITVLTSSASKWGLYKKIAPEEIRNLIENVENLNLKKGISNSLIVKLDAAINILQDANVKNDGAAINSLKAFINEVEAQREKQIENNDADVLIGKAQHIIAILR